MDDLGGDLLCFHGKPTCVFCFGASARPTRWCPSCGRSNLTGHICRACVRAGVIDAPRLSVEADSTPRELVGV